MKMMWMLAFTLLPLMAIAYISWHVWCLFPLSWIWKTLAIMLMVGSFLLMFAGIFRSTDKMPMPLATAVYEIGTSSIFILLYLFMLFVVLDLGRLVHLISRTLLYNNWWVTGGIAFFMIALFVYGHLHYKHKVREELTLKSEKVSKPVKLVMVSDLHLGYHNQREEFHRWVDLINAEKPDLILIAGDIIDGSMRPLKDQKMYEEFHRLSAPIYACLGNHEYYSGEPDAQQFYRDANIHLLQDSATVVGDLCIIGRDDRTNIHRKSLGKIMEESSLHTPHSSFLILLDHQPYHLEQAERQHIDFQFSGHTHHGQVWPISWITEPIYECAFGAHKRGHTNYYVSSGLGIWGGKFRIGTRSEYVVLNLQR
ncbi:MAG: metallophosphoesterase [Prevotella sp.]|nr:metallophosphoesterase [Prevotella sp.]